MIAIDVAALLTRSAELKERAAAGEALGLVDTIDAHRPMAQLIIPLGDVLEARGLSTTQALAVASEFVRRLTPEPGECLH